MTGMIRFSPISLVLATALSACGPFSRSAEPEHRKPVSGDSLAATLDVKVQNGVQFALRVTNNTPAKLELLFPNGQTHDFVVVDSLGREVWRWSEGRMFTQVLQNRVLDTHGTLAIDAFWHSKLPPGQYVAIASLLSENKPLEQRVQFELK
jgi:hypothetical protein